MQGTNLELFRREVACACIGYVFFSGAYHFLSIFSLLSQNIFRLIYRSGGWEWGQIMRENMIEEKQQMTIYDDRVWNDFSNQCSPEKDSNTLWLFKRGNALKHETLNGLVSISNDEPCYNNFPKLANLSFQIILTGMPFSITELSLFEHGWCPQLSSRSSLND